MSWITGLADKAENILNKIDQNAATALQITENQTLAAPSVALDSVKRSLSNSTQSLKSTFSPTKVSQKRGETGGLPSSSRSVHSDIGVMNISATSADYQEKVLELNNKSQSMTSSRRNSNSSKDDIVIAIDTPNSTPQNEIRHSFTQSKSSNALDYQELLALKIVLNEITQERDELRIQLNTLNRDVETAGLRQRVNELEMLIQQLSEERDEVRQNLFDAQTAGNAYIHSISELETNLAKMQQEYMEMANKLQMQLRETEQKQHELQEYRTKAQLALQMKDSLIAELRANNGMESYKTQALETQQDANASRQVEFEELNQKYQHMLMENQTLSMQIEELRRENSLINQRHAQELIEMEKLRKELRMERERVMSTESEQRVLTKELETLRQQLSNQMAASATRLQEKEDQVQKLLFELSDRRNNGDESLRDLHTRIKTLTQTLVDKQNALEIVSSDRNGMRIQLEKLQNELGQKKPIYDGNTNIGRNHFRNPLLNSTDDVKAQFPSLMRENPFDNRVARRVKRAYTSLDSIGIRLGAFLRRYPLMRICVLLYVGLLHIWVVFVLLSSTPN